MRLSQFCFLCPSLMPAKYSERLCNPQRNLHVHHSQQHFILQTFLCSFYVPTHFQLLMGSQLPSVDGSMKKSTRLLEKAEGYICLSPSDEYLLDEATADCHCHKTASKRLFPKLWILMASSIMMCCSLSHHCCCSKEAHELSQRPEHPCGLITLLTLWPQQFQP